MKKTNQIIEHFVDNSLSNHIGAMVSKEELFEAMRNIVIKEICDEKAKLIAKEAGRIQKEKQNRDIAILIIETLCLGIVVGLLTNEISTVIGFLKTGSLIKDGLITGLWILGFTTASAILCYLIIHSYLASYTKK